MLRSSTQRNEGRDQQTTYAQKYLPVFKEYMRHNSNYRQPHRSSYSTETTGAAKAISMGKIIKKRSFNCLLHIIRVQYVAGLS